MKRFLIILVLISSFKISAQDIQLVITKEKLLNAFKTLIDARAASFSSYTPGFGVDMYNVRLFYSTSKPLTLTLIEGENRFSLSCGVIGRANVNYYAGSFDINGEGDVTIEGHFYTEEGTNYVSINASGDGVISFSGGLPAFLVSIFTSNQFHVNLPDFELTRSLGILEIPSEIEEYFENPTKVLIVNNDKLVIGLQTNSAISGSVLDIFNTPISGTSISFSNNGGTAITDQYGNYKKIVPHDWQGTATPQKSGYTFYPSYTTYQPISLSKGSENYEAYPTDYIISSNKTIPMGTYNITQNVTVNNGATLTLNPGATLRFNTGINLIVNGILNAVGDVNNRITFISINGTSGGSWGSIELNGSGASGSEISNADISYGNQVRVINVPDFDLSYNFFTNNNNSIYVSGSSGIISHNYLTSNSTGHSILIENSSDVDCGFNNITKTSPNQRRGAGIQYGGGSSGDVIRNNISYCDWGIGAIWGSSPRSYFFAPGNKVTNCNVGINVYRESYPIFGYALGDMYSGHSIYYNTKNASVGMTYTSYPSGLYAIGNWWGEYPPNTSLFSVGSSAYFYYNQALDSDPWAGLGKANNNISPYALGDVPNIFNEDIDDPIYYGIFLREEKKYKEAMEYFIKYLDEYPENQRAYVELYNCYSKETINELIEYFSYLPKEASKDHKLLLSYLYNKNGDYKSAKNINNEIIAENLNTSLATRAKINNLYIAMYNENNLSEAMNIFNNSISQRSSETFSSYDFEDVSNAIKNYAEINGSKISDFELYKSISSDESKIPNEFVLYDNYPNPFNPTTIISYMLPVKSNVKISIFDITGKLLKSYVNTSQSAGYRTLEWNGENENGAKVASGVYIYRMEAVPLEENYSNFITSKKMLLIK